MEISIIRPHHRTYVDAAYCYRQSSVVCRSVCHNAKTAKPIDMPFGLSSRVGLRNHVLHRGPDPAMERGNYEGEWRLVVKYSDCLP